MSIECPKRYGVYDVTNTDCKECGRGLLYQLCTNAKTELSHRHLACHGWNDENGEPWCCVCYKELKNE